MSTVTIIMSAYNSGLTLKQAVDSILAQTHHDFRLVVYDDASTDDTADILRGYDDPRVDARYLTANRGLTRNLALGVAEADTPYIARMDADDIAAPDRLAAQVSYLESHPEIDVLGTNVVFFDDEGHESIGIQPEHHCEIALELFFGFTMMHPTIMMRRSALVAGEFNYDPHFRYSQDFDLWSRMVPHHGFANLQRPLLRLREHPRKVSRAHRSEQQLFTTEIRARQIRRVMPRATDLEIEVFSAAARGDLPMDRTELVRLEEILVRLIAANSDRAVYSVVDFEAAAAGFFRRICRSMLHESRTGGAHYLCSSLRAKAPAEPLRTTLSFLALAGLATLGLGVRR